MSGQSCTTIRLLLCGLCDISLSSITADHGGCHMGDTGAEVLAKHYSSTNQLLEVLDFTGNDLTAVGMVHVMKMVKTSEPHY